jgi:hypothetical protein
VCFKINAHTQENDMTTTTFSHLGFHNPRGARFATTSHRIADTIKARNVLATVFGLALATAILTAPAILGHVYGTKCSNQYEPNSSAWAQCVLKASFSREVDIARR